MLERGPRCPLELPCCLPSKYSIIVIGWLLYDSCSERSKRLFFKTCFKIFITWTIFNVFTRVADPGSSVCLSVTNRYVLSKLISLDTDIAKMTVTYNSSGLRKSLLLPRQVERRKCCQQSTNDGRLFIVPSDYLCTQRHRRDTTRRAGPSAETCLCFSLRTFGTTRPCYDRCLLHNLLFRCE